MHKQLISTLAENKPLEASLLNRFVNENERLRQLIREQSDQLTLLQNKLNNQEAEAHIILNEYKEKIVKLENNLFISDQLVLQLNAEVEALNMRNHTAMHQNVERIIIDPTEGNVQLNAELLGYKKIHKKMSTELNGMKKELEIANDKLRVMSMQKRISVKSDFDTALKETALTKNDAWEATESVELTNEGNLQNLTFHDGNKLAVPVLSLADRGRKRKVEKKEYNMSKVQEKIERLGVKCGDLGKYKYDKFFNRLVEIIELLTATLEETERKLERLSKSNKKEECDNRDSIVHIESHILPSVERTGLTIKSKIASKLKSKNANMELKLKRESFVELSADNGTVSELSGTFTNVSFKHNTDVASRLVKYTSENVFRTPKFKISLLKKRELE